MNLPAAVQCVACLPVLFATVLVVEPARAPGKASRGWRETGVWTRQTFAWLAFVFCYGLATSAANYFGPVFLAERHWHLHILVSNVHFTADVLGRGTFLLSMECVPTAGSVGTRCVACE